MLSPIDLRLEKAIYEQSKVVVAMERVKQGISVIKLDFGLFLFKGEYGSVEVNGKIYQNINKLFIKSPAEHKLNGDSFDVEVQLVTDRGLTLVLLFKAINGEGDTSLFSMLGFGENRYNIMAHNLETNTFKNVVPNQMFDNPSNVYMYDGSSTNGFCETTKYIIDSKTHYISRNQFIEIGVAQNHYRTREGLKDMIYKRNFESNVIVINAPNPTLNTNQVPQSQNPNQPNVVVIRVNGSTPNIQNNNPQQGQDNPRVVLVTNSNPDASKNPNNTNPPTTTNPPTMGNPQTGNTPNSSSDPIELPGDDSHDYIIIKKPGNLIVIPYNATLPSDLQNASYKLPPNEELLLPNPENFPNLNNSGLKWSIIYYGPHPIPKKTKEGKVLLVPHIIPVSKDFNPEIKRGAAAMNIPVYNFEAQNMESIPVKVGTDKAEEVKKMEEIKEKPTPVVTETTTITSADDLGKLKGGKIYNAVPFLRKTSDALESGIRGVLRADKKIDIAVKQEAAL